MSVHWGSPSWLPEIANLLCILELVRNGLEPLSESERDEELPLNSMAGSKAEAVNQRFPGLSEPLGCVNPTTGLPMIGDIDVEGNAFGTSSPCVDCSPGVKGPFCEHDLLDLGDNWV